MRIWGTWKLSKFLFVILEKTLHFKKVLQIDSRYISLYVFHLYLSSKGIHFRHIKQPHRINIIDVYVVYIYYMRYILSKYWRTIDTDVFFPYIRELNKKQYARFLWCFVFGFLRVVCAQFYGQNIVLYEHTTVPCYSLRYSFVRYVCLYTVFWCMCV